MEKNTIKLFLGIICLIAVVLVPTVQAKGFILKVNLYDGQKDSGKVKVNVLSEATNKEKSRSLDVGKIVSRTGNSNIEVLSFGFSDRELLPNGAFSACVVSVSYGTTQCEHADRHGSAPSAIIWIQVPR